MDSELQPNVFGGRRRHTHRRRSVKQNPMRKLGLMGISRRHRRRTASSRKKGVFGW
jgi:hypothetical protein